MPSNLSMSVHFFIQLAVTLVCCWSLGAILRRLGQPQVVADMVAGFLLGPALLGFLLPAVQRWLFPATVSLGKAGEIPHPSFAVLYVFGQLGLVLYMFTVGLSFDGAVLRNHVGSVAASSVAGVLTPIVTGGVLGWLLAGNSTFFGAHIAAWQAALFMGASMAITAFPMLARIIKENKTIRSSTGTVALACAAVDDTMAWILLAVVVSAVRSDPSVALLALGGAIAYTAFMLTLGRRAFARLGRWSMGAEGLRVPGITLTLVALLLSAAVTDVIGIYAVAGAFLCGVAMPRGVFNDALRDLIEPITVRLLLPLFFVYSGLNTHFNLLLDTTVVMTLLAIVVIAFCSKGFACMLGARLSGMDWRSSAAIGALMNARGLMELILLNIGLESGLVTPALYTVLAVMTIVTTLAATPLYSLVRRVRWKRIPSAMDGNSGHVDEQFSLTDR